MTVSGSDGLAVPVRRGRAATICLVLGVLVLAALWLGPLVPIGRRAFSIHMLLHLGVVVVASPLLGFALAQRLPVFASFGSALSWCLLAGALELTVVWGWHVPVPHDLAARSDVLFAVEQASFLAAGLGLWTALFAARSRPTAGAAALVSFFTFTHMTMFGLVLTLSPRLLYDPNLCLGAFGLDRVDDQHLGGILMTLGGGLPYLAATGWALILLLSQRPQPRSPQTAAQFRDRR